MKRIVVFIFALFLMYGQTAASAASRDTVWLSGLDLKHMRQGYGSPQKDRSVTEKPLSIAGRKFERGVGTHAPGFLWVELSGRAEKFIASVGVDDGASGQPGSVVFRILGDGKKLWESAVMRPGDIPASVELPLNGVKNIVLMVGDAGDGIAYDHADWADARFIMHGGAPVASEPPSEKPLVLTPKPSPKPRINGAKVYGARPGSPFLFKVPATGTRPLRYRAEGLPEGLSIDEATGIITGAIARPGVSVATLVVSNRLGKASRTLRIVCGDTLALTPHMGWNSWYVWENHVTQDIIRAAADAMSSSGMIDHGYMYVNIDDCWAVKPGSTDPMLAGELRDADSMVNANRRFPDMKGLTDHIHSLGLKAGIYTSPGPTTCAGHTGAYQHEEADVRRFVQWGYDFLKYDWCSYGDIDKGGTLEGYQKPYREIARILRAQKRDIVLNLCQYGLGNVWEWGREVGGNSWRTAGDLGGSFEGIATAIFRDGFDVYTARELHRYGRPGGWNDPDYLLLGYLSNWEGQTVPTPLTPSEQYTHVTLWCLVAAPLIFSGDITRLDAFTLSLLTNDEVIEVDQDPLGRPGRRIAVDEDREVWMKDLEDGSHAVGLFNRGEFPATVKVKWQDLGLSGKQKVRDLWRQKDIGALEDGYSVKISRHGCVLLKVRPAK